MVRRPLTGTVTCAVGAILLASCGSPNSGIRLAAAQCELSDHVAEGKLVLASENGDSPLDIDCVLHELADGESYLYFYGPSADVPGIGSREIRNGVWAAWLFGTSGSFVFKIADSEDAATG